MHLSLKVLILNCQNKANVKVVGGFMCADIFSQALSDVCDIPSSQLPKPILKGDKFSAAIPEE